MPPYQSYHGDSWLVVLRFNATLTGHIMVVSDAYVFPGFLTPVLTQLFFPKPQTTFLTCFCRGERQKYARKKSHLNRGLNSQPPGHETETLTTEPSRRGITSTAHTIHVFWDFISSRMGLLRVLPKDTPTKTPEHPVPLEPRIFSLRVKHTTTKPCRTKYD